MGVRASGEGEENEHVTELIRFDQQNFLVQAPGKLPPHTPPLARPDDAAVRRRRRAVGLARRHFGVHHPREVGRGVRAASSLPTAPAFCPARRSRRVSHAAHPRARSSFGRVFKARIESTGSLAAIKIVPVEQDTGEVEREINTLKHCQSPNIVAYFGSVQRGGELWIVMEFCAGSSLCDIMESSAPAHPPRARRLPRAPPPSPPSPLARARRDARPSPPRREAVPL